MPAPTQLAREHQGFLKIGIGNSDALNRQDRSYQAAEIALASLIGEQNLAVFDQLDLEIFLGTVPTDAKRRFPPKTVSSLEEKNRDILKTYFGCGMSLKAASSALFMHKNTLQYQLDRILEKQRIQSPCLSGGGSSVSGLEIIAVNILFRLSQSRP